MIPEVTQRDRIIEGVAQHILNLQLLEYFGPPESHMALRKNEMKLANLVTDMRDGFDRQR